MTAAKHTPTQERWSWDAAEGCYEITRADDPDYVIATCHVSTDAMRLAAAPALLAVAELVERAHGADRDRDEHDTGLIGELVDAARAAIAAARGES